MNICFSCQGPDGELPGGFGVPESAVKDAKEALAKSEVARKLTQVCVRVFAYVMRTCLCLCGSECASV